MNQLIFEVALIIPFSLLLIGAVVIGLFLPMAFTPAGWFTGIALVLFSVLVQFTPHRPKE